MTADELFDLPDDGNRRELYLGHVLSEPPAGADHGDVGARLLILLGNHVSKHDLGRIFNADTGFVLSRSPDTVRAPDIAFVSRERIEPLGRVKSFFPGPPDLAVEVLSPSERAGTIHSKVGDYLAAGCRMVWLVDPDAQTITVHRPLGTARVVPRDQSLSGEDIVPGFAFRVSEIFPA